MTLPLRRAFADTPRGQIHYADAGEGKPVLFLHQTPRSWTEFRDVLPIVGRRRRAIAMDTLGYGDSSPPAQDTIESYAEGPLALMDALGIERASVVGHHTGGVVAVHLAAEHPDRVDRLVLSCTRLVDAAGRRRRQSLDDAAPRDDGSHLVELWRGRQAIYPEGRRDLLAAFIVDALKAGWPRAGRGHMAVADYVMETRLPRIQAPTLLLCGTLDPTFPDQARMATALPQATVEEIEGGMVPLPDQMPERFAAAVLAFLLAEG